MRGFARLFAGDVVSMLGDWFTYVGIGVIAVSQGAPSLVVLLIAHTLPRALIAPLAGAVIDRVDRRVVLVAGSAARGAAALGMAIAALEHAWWTVQALHLVRMALGAFPDAAVRASLPRLVPAARIGRANAQLGVAWSVAFAIGVAAGGVTVAAAGAATAFAIDGASFAIAAIVFATLPAMAPKRGTAPILLKLCTAKVPAAIATGAAWIAVQEHVGTAAIAMGTVHAARAVGAGVAPMLWPARWRERALGLHVATAIAIAGAAAASLAPSPWTCAIWGAGVAVGWITATTRWQLQAPGGRAAALDLQAQAIAQCAGGVIAVAVDPLAGLALALIAWAVIA